MDERRRHERHHEHRREHGPDGAVGPRDVRDEPVERWAGGDRDGDERDREPGRGAHALGACDLGDHRDPEALVADQGETGDRDDRADERQRRRARNGEQEQRAGQADDVDREQERLAIAPGVAIADESPDDAADDPGGVRDHDEDRSLGEREAGALVEIEREKRDERVLAGDDEAAPDRQQHEIAVAADVPLRTDGPWRPRQAAQGQERHGGECRHAGGGRERPAPVRHVRDPRQRRRRDQAGDRNSRLPDAEREAAAVLGKGEQDEPAAGRCGARACGTCEH